MSRLRFSIVTPTYNRLNFLISAAASLDSQGDQSWEHLIIDGGSSDGTLEWARSRPRTLIISEPDNGVYDAMNKGLALARGDVVGFLNSDDRYEPSALEVVAAAFAHDPTAASVSGIALIEENGRIVECVDRPEELGIEPHAVLLGRCAPNSRFFRREAALETGLFDPAFPYVADRDWLLRFAALGHGTVALPEAIYRYLRHHDSLTFDPQRRHVTAIRRDRLQLGLRWRSKQLANVTVHSAAARLEAKMRLAVALDEVRALHPIRALLTVSNLHAWWDLTRAW